MTVYEIGDLEVFSLVPDGTRLELLQFGAWLKQFPYFESQSLSTYSLLIPGGEFDIGKNGCPLKYQPLMRAFLEHTHYERLARPVRLILTLGI